MAVPERRNGLLDNGDEEDAILMEEGDALRLENEVVIPPHLHEFAAATKLGDVFSLRIALDHLNGSINEPVEDGDSALHLACLYGYFPCVQLLLERGANIEVKDEDGAIPLHDACAGGFADIVQLIFNHACNLDTINRMLRTVDVEGDTPMHHAARGEHANVVRLLLAAGAPRATANIYGEIPRDLADPNTEAWRILDGNN
ncbi:BRCA1-associated RING domain protein 1 [Impatiens glandulifera]|uniref:BRCA1-associated RING domain protein 1 n=1 Tax=Impatiens glandulifera TaxID=253017 RepID=UPI001FB0B5D5|nr:BRCA1-associated RING domain protein 1 [Impatiens glandulifera]